MPSSGMKIYIKKNDIVYIVLSSRIDIVVRGIAYGREDGMRILWSLGHIKSRAIHIDLRVSQLNKHPQLFNYFLFNRFIFRNN